MMDWRRVALVLTMVIFAGHAQAFEAGFDCAKATSPVEKLICGDADLAKLDRDMAQRYAALPRETVLQRDQRAFVAQRERCAAPERGAPPSKAALDNCVWDMTTSRLDELTRLAAKQASAWDVFTERSDAARQTVCLARNGRDGSDTVQVIRRRGQAAPGAVQFEEFAYKGVGILRDGDTGTFDVDGKAFPGMVAIDPESRGKEREFRIVARGDASPLLEAMESGHLLLVKRNGKAVFRAALDGFAPAYDRISQDCGG